MSAVVLTLPVTMTVTLRLPTERTSAVRGRPVMVTRQVTVPAVCPVCGGPRGKAAPARGFDATGSFVSDVWANPCGHLDLYTDVAREALA